MRCFFLYSYLLHSFLAYAYFVASVSRIFARVVLLNKPKPDNFAGVVVNVWEHYYCQGIVALCTNTEYVVHYTP